MFGKYPTWKEIKQNLLESSETFRRRSIPHLSEGLCKHIMYFFFFVSKTSLPVFLCLSVYVLNAPISQTIISIFVQDELRKMAEIK